MRVFNQGQRAAVANADGFNVWVLDIASSSPAIELQVSCCCSLHVVLAHLPLACHASNSRLVHASVSTT